jgi:uncharacterized protein YecE (DUF72 family)
LTCSLFLRYHIPREDEAKNKEVYMEGDNKLYIGTAGWAYPDWNGVVYPKTLPAGSHALEFMARRVGCVEINTSFYQHLKPEIVKLWIKKVEAHPSFQFTAKLHRQFTHDRCLEQGEIDQAKRGLWPLLREQKLGGLLMQFPWAFRFTAENQEFLIRLHRAFHEFPLVAEVRHASWLAEEAIGTFLDYRIGFCNIDQPEYTSAMPPTSHLTSAVGYVRLHGRNPRNTLGAYERNAPPAMRARQHDYLYSETELEEWSKRIERIQRFAEKTFVIFNNDAAGKSMVNALQLEAMMLESRVGAPKELRRRFPMELERLTARHAEQQYLFPAA